MALVPYLQVDNLSYAVGDKRLFGSLSFSLAQGQKVALVARNGTGKSTLLRLLAGQLTPDSGAMVWRKGLRVGYLEQDPVLQGEQTLRQACDRSAYPMEMERLLTLLSLTEWDKPLRTFSGGQQKRVALAQVLSSGADVLLLDEPTNHLDLPLVEWLESYLSKSSITLLLVTHDRYFLDAVCTSILELDNGQLFAYQGAYTYYLEKRAERLQTLQTLTDKARNLYRTELEWMRRMPQARAHKAQYRIDNFAHLSERAHTQINDSAVRLEVQASYIGSKIFEAKAVSKRYGDRIILEHFTYTFARYEKVGIIGANGAGKSTFLRLLLGLEPPDSGCFEVGTTVRFGYYSQQGREWDKSKKVIEAVTEVAEYITLSNGKRLSASQFLQHFLFSPSQQHDYIAKLSGGEKRRLELCLVLLQNPNFLLLDEPTNDLDIPTLTLLEDWLQQFAGCVIIVSHDRYFMDKTVDHLFVFEGNGVVKDYPGNYTDYRLSQKETQQTAGTNASGARSQNATALPTSTATKPTARPRKLSYKEQQELKALDALLPQLQIQKAELETLLSGGETDAQKIATLSAQYQALLQEIDEKEFRWLELTD